MKHGPEKLSLHTEDPTSNNLDALRLLLPGVVNDGVVDCQKLSELIGLPVSFSNKTQDRFGLMWAGRDLAVNALRTPSMATLIPDDDPIGDWNGESHVFIEGDNLEVLKLLQKSYNDKVKLIYIDPPYNTGGDFVYRDDFSDTIRHYLEVTGQIDSAGNRLFANTEVSGRKSSNWLSMMMPRLVLARNLLKEDGLIFVSIDDYEINDLKLLMDEVFGPANYLSTLVWNRGHSQQQGIFKKYHEYVLVYARNATNVSNFSSPEEGEVVAGAIKKVSKSNPESEFTFPAGVNCLAPDGTEFKGTWGDAEKIRIVKGRFRVQNGKTLDEMTLAAGWTQKNQMTAFFRGDEEVIDSRGQKLIDFFFSASGKCKYRKEKTAYTPASIQSWGTQGAASGQLEDLMGGVFFDRPKPVAMIRDFVSWCTEKDDLVMDFFAGSGTTAQAVMERNAQDGGHRKFILINLPEPTPEDSTARKAGFTSVADITKKRILKLSETYSDLNVRFLKISKSNFVVHGEDVSDFLPILKPKSLSEKLDPRKIFLEIVLKTGTGVDSAWSIVEINGSKLYATGTILFFPQLDLDIQTVDSAIECRNYSLMVFLEDAFENKDDVKANIYFALKKANIQMKTL